MARRPESALDSSLFDGLPSSPLDGLPNDLLNDLREKIAAIEVPPGPPGAGPAGADEDAVTLGDPALDRALPGHGLRRGGLHEIIPEGPRDRTAAMGFCTAVIARLLIQGRDRGPVLWCARRDRLYDSGFPHGAGLSALGLDPDRLIVVAGARDVDILWAMEEGLSSRRLSAVVGELGTADLTATRRLSLAARNSGRTGFLLSGPRERREKCPASAALTRWRISAAPLPRVEDTAVAGGPRWRVALTRCRGGRPRDWLVEWDYEAHCFSVVAPVADRPPVPGAAEIRDPGSRRARAS